MDALTSLIEVSPQGLYCPPGQFHIDPWSRVDLAITTHGHADHARSGSRRYLTATPGKAIVQERVGANATVDALDYGAPCEINSVRVSLHPAGHLLGSAQVRIEHAGEVVVVSGDYKTDPDPTCAPFEAVPCDVFITECTFGLPVYRWPDAAAEFAEINAWWRANQLRKETSVIFAYALGKAQRVLAGLDASIGTIYAHGAVRKFVDVYRAAGVDLPEITDIPPRAVRVGDGRGMVLAPPSAAGSTWLRKFGSRRTAFASGWMQVRGARRRRHADRGFVISDHADFEGILGAIRATGAKRIGVTHGATAPLARYLREQGYTAAVVPTRRGDAVEDDAA